MKDPKVGDLVELPVYKNIGGLYMHGSRQTTPHTTTCIGEVISIRSLEALVQIPKICVGNKKKEMNSQFQKLITGYQASQTNFWWFSFDVILNNYGQ